MKRILAALAVVLVAASAALAAPDRTCPTCRRAATDMDWTFCPFDGTRLVEPKGYVPHPQAGNLPHPQGGTLTAEPLSGGAPEGTRPPASVVGDFFEAITAGDAEGVRRTARWDAFFAMSPGPDLDAKTADYLAKVMKKVRPTLVNRVVHLTDVRLGPKTAELKYELRDRDTGQKAGAYEFTLTLGEGGWKIVAIRP